jgi:S-adenosylmethionine/arginine decarboxylase-like enzyme
MIVHKHLIVRAKINNPPKNMTWTSNWFEELISKIGMKLLRGPIGAYVDVPGNKGMTMVAVIETSHIAMHIWDEESPALLQLDVYTCGKLDPKTVFEHMEQFDIVEKQFLFLDREVDILEITNEYS